MEARISRLEAEAIQRSEELAVLRQRAERLGQIFLFGRDGMMLLDGDSGRVEEANRAFAEISGLSLSEMQNTPFWELPPLSVTDAPLVAFRELRSRDHIYYDELPFLRSDGSRTSVEMTCSVHRCGNKRMIHCVFRDISKRREIEDALRQSDVRFRALFESAPLGIAFLDPSGIIVENNPALDTMLGYRRGELAGTHFSIYGHPEEGGMDSDLFQELATGTRSTYRTAKRCRRKDGALLWGLLSMSPLPERHRAAKYIIAMIEDITERKRAEETVIRSRDFYRLLLNELPNPIRLADSDGRCDYFNRAWAAFTGRPAEQEWGDGWTKGIHPDDRERVLTVLQDAVRNRIPFTAEYRLLRSPGEYRWIMEFGTPFTEAKEKVSGYLSSCYDIHDRKALEETLESMSITDELTGLLNRRGFFALAQQQMRIAGRTMRGLLLFYGDLDGLKQINDTLGHQAGDQALVEAAAVLREVFRESDIVARLGGDEFAVLLLEDTGSPDETAILERLHRAIRTRNAQVGRTYQLSLSAGIRRYDPESPVSLDRLISVADSMMYEEKKRRKTT